LRLETFLSARELERAARLAAPDSSRPTRVLLTGVSGFLGRFLLLELLARLPEHGKVYCLVRAASDAAARERIAASFGRAHPALRDSFVKLATPERMVAVAGDFASHQLGLGDDGFGRLAERVDAIVHCGAHVNHALSYAQLFQPNVAGTAEIARLALRHTLKPVSFLSTSGVARRDAGVEDSGKHAAGYVTSKWAAELLMEQLRDRYHVPVDILRCSSIMAHSELRGEINPTDFLSRLLISVVDTGVAPASFYSSSAAERHFDGLPVDFVARAIAFIAAGPGRDGGLYHLVNPHRTDGVGLDAFVDWVVSYGYRVERIPSYAEWYERFANALKAQNDDRRRHSSFPLLQRWQRPIASSGAALDVTRFRERLGELNAEIPHVTEAHIHKCLTDLCQLGLLRPPQSRCEFRTQS
jgi:fatty acid CoA ligase FadD9